MQPVPSLLFAACVGLAGLATSLPGQGAVSLLVDVETAAPENPGSFYEPRLMGGVTWNSYLYFAADGDGFGAELWRTDGSVQSATLVADLRPGAGSDPQLLGVMGGWLLFIADDGELGRELWRTDGSLAGTQILRDLTPGRGSTFDSDTPFVRYGNWLYFLAGGRLWKTDGSAGNTIAVSTTDMGAETLVAGGSQLWIGGYSGGMAALWSSDGGSSVNLARQLPSSPEGLTGLPGIRCVFVCDDGIAGQELWTSDGSFGGTQVLVDLEPGANSSWPSYLTGWNGIALFGATSGGSSRLWRTDGTVAGTFALDPAVGPRSPQNLAAAGGRVYFTARANGGPNIGWELWATDGTLSGTAVVFDIWPGSPTSGAAQFAYDGTQWTYFTAHDGATGYELWRSDGTTTQRVSDIVPGFGDGSPTVLGFVGGRCVCAAQYGDGPELFASQGNATQLVRDIRIGTNGQSIPGQFHALVDGRFWFAARRGPYYGPGGLGFEPHFSDGSQGSGQMLVDAWAGSQSGLSPLEGAASFGAYTVFRTRPQGKLWRTAGTVPSTNAIPNVFARGNPVVLAGRVYFAGNTAATGTELFTVDPASGNATLVVDLMPGAGDSVDALAVVGNRLFFSARDAQGNNLYTSDGTAAGTWRVWVNPYGGNYFDLRALGRRLVFDMGFSPGPLVVCDGATTTVLGPVNQTHERVVSGDRLFFAGEIPGSGTGLELCMTDGATLTFVKDIRPGSESSQIYSLCPFRGGVLFIANDGTSGFELWRSDGTAAGTQRVIDLVPGRGSGCPANDWNGLGYTGMVWAPAGAARAVFGGTNGSHGVELYSTDGSTGGTTLHAELQPGALGSFPGAARRCGRQVVFAATRSEPPATNAGRELFAMPTMAAAEAFGTPCGGTLATAPLAHAVDTPTLNNAAFGLAVRGASLTPAVLLLGDPADVAFGACSLHVANFVALPAMVTDAGGQAILGLPVPGSTSLAGARLGAQWVVLQTGGPFLGLAALSNGVDIVVQGR